MYLCLGMSPLQEALKLCYNKKVQVGKDQEKAQSEKDSHSKNQGGKPAFSFLIRSNTIHLTTSVKEHKICYPMHIRIVRRKAFSRFIFLIVTRQRKVSNQGPLPTHSNSTTDQHLCFCHTDSTISLNVPFGASSLLL